MELDQLRFAADVAEYAPFVGQWRRLVSTTNWEKGRIISEWRQAAIGREAPTTEYSDEAWSRLVGGISPQHVGRLRRVHDRFDGVQTTYAGLFWSHFFAALEWEDAEMWLEGAVQNRWSVSQMRRQRWETLGGDEPAEIDVIETEIDEDLHTTSSATPQDEILHGTDMEVRTLMSDMGDEAAERRAEAVETPNAVAMESATTTTSMPEPVRPFENLVALPADLEEAMELVKVAILRHKLDGWRAISADAVLQSLDALKQLVVSP